VVNMSENYVHPQHGECARALQTMRLKKKVQGRGTNCCIRWESGWRYYISGRLAHSPAA
jgi:hypothetical protein